MVILTIDMCRVSECSVLMDVMIQRSLVHMFEDVNTTHMQRARQHNVQELKLVLPFLSELCFEYNVMMCLNCNGML